jgi:hypothetical protein
VKALQRKASPSQKVEIATMHFGYRNGAIIKLLKKRGAQIQMGKL